MSADHEEAPVDLRVDAMKAAWWANRSPESLEDAFRTELAKRGSKILVATSTTPSSNVGADASRGHTAAPWQITDSGVRAASGYICLAIKPHHFEGQDERYAQETAEREANARLIAAAPELLEALEELVRRTPFLPHEKGIELVISFEQIKRLQDALAKAKGGSK